MLLAWSVAGHAQAAPLELEARVAEHVREIRAANPDLRDDVFSKMGGSSVESRAFLHCFASPYVDLGEHEVLSDTLDYFNQSERNSFERESDAAGVSWNLRYVLGGRPAQFRRELEETEARWALVLFGANDAQNENERIYVRRLVYLIEQLEDKGVVPILGSALPRRSPSKDRWISRFNAITEAVAEHWSLPYIDYHAALNALPRKGLARDGVHPNVLGEGGVRAACQLTEKGLRYGNNVRNLLTLEMLDALRRVVAGTGADAGAGTDAGAGAGTGTDAGTDAGTGTDAGAGADTVPDPFPVSALVSKSSLPLAGTLPKRCGSPAPGSRIYRFRVGLEARGRFRASAFDLDGQRFPVYWVRVDPDGEQCVRRRSQTLEVDVPPGMWDFIVEVPERAAQEGQMLVLITRDPR
jgi:hypothetical protein